MKFKKIVAFLAALSILTSSSTFIYAAEQENTNDFSIEYDIMYDDEKTTESDMSQDETQDDIVPDVEIIYDDSEEESADIIVEDESTDTLIEESEEQEELVGSTPTKGTWNGFKWYIDNDKLVISGKGTMPDATKAAWKTPSLQQSIRTVTIDGGITSIGKNAFSDFEFVENIRLPATVKTLEDYCFANCPRLHTVFIPSVLTTIKTGVFENDTRIDSTIFSKEVLSHVKVYKNAFLNSGIVINPITLSVNNLTAGMSLTWNKPIQASAYGVSDNDIKYSIYRIDIPITKLETSRVNLLYEGLEKMPKIIATIPDGYKLIGTVTNQTTFTDKTAKNGHYYEYIVYSKVKGKDNRFMMNVKGHVRLSTPVIKSVSSSKSAMTVSWSPISNITGYKIMYSTDSSFKNYDKVVVVGASKTNATIKNLSKGKKYYIKIQTYKGINLFGMKESRKCYYSKASGVKNIVVK